MPKEKQQTLKFNKTGGRGKTFNGAYDGCQAENRRYNYQSLQPKLKYRKKLEPLERQNRFLTWKKYTRFGDKIAANSVFENLKPN